MNPCQNCGKLNSGESNFCRFCGTKFNVRQAVPKNPYNDYSSPRPYAWKTDEFQTQTEPRPTEPVHAPTQPFDPASYQPAPLSVHSAPPGTYGAFSCPHCASWAPPRVERRISTAGWIIFAVLLVFFFPLFWIGLLIKEEVQICPTCNSKIDRPKLYR
jgi:hypothetical protein